MPDTVLDAGESMMNKTSVVPALTKLTIRGGGETTLFGSTRCSGCLVQAVVRKDSPKKVIFKLKTEA